MRGRIKGKAGEGKEGGTHPFTGTSRYAERRCARGSADQSPACRRNGTTEPKRAQGLAAAVRGPSASVPVCAPQHFHSPSRTATAAAAITLRLRLHPQRLLGLQRPLGLHPRHAAPSGLQTPRCTGAGPAPGYGWRRGPSQPRDRGPGSLSLPCRLRFPACPKGCAPQRTSHSPSHLGSLAPSPKWRVRLRVLAEQRRLACKAAAALHVRSPTGTAAGNMHFSIPETESRSGDSGGSAYVVRSGRSRAGQGRG